MNPFEHANPAAAKQIAEKIVPIVNGKSLPEVLVAMLVIIEELAKASPACQTLVTHGMAQVLYNLDKTINFKNN
jgi:hypothetical protein